MTAARVVLWRHGRTAHNRDGVWQGQIDTPLDDVGVAQAGAGAAALMAGLSSPELRPQAIVASDLVRASATAVALAALTGLDVVLDKRLREIHAGRWEGRSRAEIEAAGWGEEQAAWRRGDDVPAGGGERRGEVGRRGAEAVRAYAEALDGGSLVVVAHGGLLRGTILTLLGLPPAQWALLGGLGNACWAELAPGEPRWRLLAYNLPPG